VWVDKFSGNFEVIRKLMTSGCIYLRGRESTSPPILRLFYALAEIPADHADRPDSGACRTARPTFFNLLRLLIRPCIGPLAPRSRYKKPSGQFFKKRIALVLSTSTSLFVYTTALVDKVACPLFVNSVSITYSQNEVADTSILCQSTRNGSPPQHSGSQHRP
jgi:hypothetical protein